MKGIDIFCASQASTAVYVNMAEASSSSSSSSSISAGGRAIDRHNPIIRDPRRIGKPAPDCSVQPPSTPEPHNQSSKNKKGSSKQKNESKKKGSLKQNDQKRKSISTEINDGIISRKSWSCTKPGDFISPPGSTRYLLGDQAFLEALSDIDPAVLKLVSAEANKSVAVNTEESSCSVKPPSSGSADQVVVLRVSLHCRGCERKMKKHISRMQGVTSFNIDFAAKKVTVVGEVTPLEVLSSISKVKNAQLWTPSMLSSSAAMPPVNYLNNPADIKKIKEGGA